MWLGFIVVSLSIIACEGAHDLADNFRDCGGFYWGLLRRCCTSAYLPKGCECFDISSATDFTNTPLTRPQCPNDVAVTMLFFDREHLHNPSEIVAHPESIHSTSFSGERKTVFVTHGFTDKADAPWMEEMKDALLAAEDLNVIIVDWEYGARGPNYLRATANTRTVGAMIGRLIQDLHHYAGASFESFHLVGHSLGAHVMGSAGTEVFRLEGKHIGRITGLDPAGPRFESFSQYVRLDPNDAMFVDVIHTDGEELISSGFGTRYSIGDVDYYPNGGQHQPGCPEETLGILSMLDFEDEISTGACSHSRAIYLFLNSISACTYAPEGPCTMGYHASSDCTGDYYPDTTDTDPFC